MVYRSRAFVCLLCGTPFSGRYSARRQFCSVACRQRHRNAPERNPAKTPEARTKIGAAEVGNTYCVGRTVSDETRSRISERLTGRTLSLEHRRAIGERVRQAGTRPPPFHRRGEAHPNWKGGLTPQRIAEFGSPEYEAFRMAVLARDGWTCQSCGLKSGMGVAVRFEVHHQKSYAEHPALRFDPENGVTLCVACHDDAHRGKRRPTRVDFHPKPRLCQHCGQEFRIRNPRKFCLACRAILCCPICGSTKCAHWQRKALPYYSQATQL